MWGMVEVPHPQHSVALIFTLPLEEGHTVSFSDVRREEGG